MIPRVTHQTVQRQTLANLQGNLSAMSALQAQMSSGKKISVPSDDPAGASDMLRLRGDQRALTQYARNASDGDSWLTTVDSALTSSLAALRRARDLTVQGGDGALGATSREALAAELEGVRDTLRDQANASYAGRTVFAGTSDAGYAFAADYSFSGSPTASPVERRIGASTTVRVDADGAAVFGTGSGSVFALLDSVAATLRSGGDPTAHLDAIDSRMDAMLTAVSSTGARHAQVLSAVSGLKDQELTVKSQLSGIEDIDLAEVILELQMQEVAYQGALGAAGKVLQPSLMDFPAMSTPTAQPHVRVAGVGSDVVDVPARLELVQALPGLPGHVRYTLEPLDDAGVLFALRSAPDDGSDAPVRLFVVSPSAHFPDYAPTIDSDALPWDAAAETTAVLAVVHPSSAPEHPPTVNLLAPLVVDTRTGLTVQVVLDGDWPLRAPVV